jgi:hypothetical protein
MRWPRDETTMLSVPPYLATADVQDRVLRYQWDDWRTMPGLETPDKEIEARLTRVSHRAVFAFSCGSGEWIVHRFAKLCDVSAAWEYLEAAWAMIVHVRYSGYGSVTGWQEYSSRGWDGPVKRPISNALRFLDIEFEQLTLSHQADPALFGGMIAVLTAYVMTDREPYKRWCEGVLGRLETLYPRMSDDPLGDVVPREAVDPDAPFDIAHTEALVRRFLAALDPRTNGFLSTPEGMLEHFHGEADFLGTPYTFNLEADRTMRLGNAG